MDFTYFIQNKEKIEVAEKAGLYAVMQSHIPKNLQAFRCGLAGKPVDSATQFKSAEGNFASRTKSITWAITWDHHVTRGGYYVPITCGITCT